MEEYQDRSLGGRVFKRLREDILKGRYKQQDELREATMRRSTNGGGENSPKLAGEDDFYELFFASLEEHI